MSAPTPATGDGSPTPGYYPDPSIPGYVRYWNGGSWVPGTSRPAPEDGTADGNPATPVPPRGIAPAAAPAVPVVPAVEETGPVFFDEEPEYDNRQEPSSAWQADASRQAGFGGERDRRVSWGSPDPRTPAEAPAAEQPTGQQPGRPALPAGRKESGVPSDTVALRALRPQGPGGTGRTSRTDGTMSIRAVRPQSQQQSPQQHQPQPQPQQPQPQQPQPPQPQQTAPPQVPAQQQARQQAPQPAPPQPQLPSQARPQALGAPTTPGPGGGAASWPQQVQQLARPGAESEEQGLPPWKPVVEDPFLQAARAQASARPASFGKRLAARLIDAVLLGAVVGAVAVPFVTKAADHISSKIDEAKLSGTTVTVWLLDGTTAGCLGVVIGAFLVLGLLYEALPTAKWGRTLGKKLCGIQVRGMETYEPPTFTVALTRWLVYGVLSLLVIGVVNVLWCLFDRPWRQCWHDKAARTFVAVG
ncbi:RDD family protein [Streptomyces sp. NPDC051322]|uniref:RDD family protein n=1 Tax=Streptomyces sp. NPDC051322 TaxID=3154645 RepID=UPI00344DA599